MERSKNGKKSGKEWQKKLIIIRMEKVVRDDNWRKGKIIKRMQH